MTTVITQRQVGRAVTVLAAGSPVIWGEAEDGVLNGGTMVAADFDNSKVASIATVKVWSKATRNDPFIDTGIVQDVPASGSAPLRLIDRSDYALRFTISFADPAATGLVVTSVEVRG